MVTVQLNRETIEVTGVKMEPSEGTPYIECSQGAIQGVDPETAKFLRVPRKVFVMFDDGRVLPVLAQFFGKVLACMILEQTSTSEEREPYGCLWPRW
jgi:hypothetical protein